ncbi:MAG TPA: FmdB family zinc ribbon protein [Balneolaceae bacterium]|nr:FmdB family zinc ribbon protein [Balneolaceae bacterium]
MPTYEYKREDGSVFEITQSINEKPLTTCPDTGQKVRRIISGGAGVIYKGTGWYVTDYKDRGDSVEMTSSSDKSTGAAEGADVKKASDKASSDATVAEA